MNDRLDLLERSYRQLVETLRVIAENDPHDLPAQELAERALDEIEVVDFEPSPTRGAVDECEGSAKGLGFREDCDSCGQTRSQEGVA